MEWLARPGIQGGIVQETRRWAIHEAERCCCKPDKGKFLPSPKMDNKIINKIIIYLSHQAPRRGIGNIVSKKDTE